MLNGAQHVHTDSGIGGDLFQAYSSSLSFCSQIFAKTLHVHATSQGESSQAENKPLRTHSSQRIRIIALR
jgi:hypothetical protein